MSDSWVVQNLENALNTWDEKMSEIWQLITQSPEDKNDAIWNVILDIHGALQAICLACTDFRGGCNENNGVICRGKSSLKSTRNL